MKPLLRELHYNLGLFFVPALLLLILVLPGRVAAQNFDEICQGVEFTGTEECGPDDTGAQSSINDVIHRGLEIFSFAVGIVAVAMIMFGGFKYITAGGDSSRIQSAQQTIIYAIIGLAIAAVAQIIAVFVIAETT